MPFATPGDPEAPVRIVLDTNVVLSALLWRGTPYHHLFQAIREAEPIELFTSEVLLEELREILLRPSPAKRLSLIRLSAGQVLAKYIETVDLVAPIATPRVVRDDIDDDHVIAAAVAAQADFIVSGDRHLLTLGIHHGIRIITAAEALQTVSASIDHNTG